jgi:hypothetical protein
MNLKSSSEFLVRSSRLLILFFLVGMTACGNLTETADPNSDMPEISRHSGAPIKNAGSYQDALQAWRTPEDINAWIGARFSYDVTRAMMLSETQRSNSNSMTIYEPAEFFASPSGVCVDLSRFAVETLRRIAPKVQSNYLMIEFAPVDLGGNTLRLHWLASFQRDGKSYFFADSKRPGYIAGPYASTQEFIAEYGKYRGRQIVTFQELESYQRKQRTLKLKQGREERP